MSTQARFPSTDEDEVPRELAELGKRIAESSDPTRAELEMAYQRVLDSVRRRRRILTRYFTNVSPGSPGLFASSRKLSLLSASMATCPTSGGPSAGRRINRLSASVDVPVNF